MGMPVSVLREEKIFERIISIKYDVPNDRPELFDQYRKQIDDFTSPSLIGTHKEATCYGS